MAKMVTIKKNGKTKLVSYAAFCTLFKDAGWVVEGEKNSPSQPVVEDKVEKADDVVETDVVEDENTVEAEVSEVNEDEVADEEWDEAIAETEVEKPLSEMNREELVAKAESLGIDVGNKNNDQLRKAIKKVM